MKRAVIGVDLGGTNMRVGVLNSDGEVLIRFKEATHASDGRQRIIARLLEQIRGQALRAGETGYSVEAVGIGAPGVIDIEKGIVVKSPNFPDWNNFGLGRELETALRLPVFIENDANAAALGEQWLGAGRGIKSMILITLGTGVGGGLVLNGEIWHGADGMAGEIGHITIIPDGRECSCGNRGCLETYTSARGIVQSYREALDRQGVPKSDPRRYYSSEKIYRAAQEGDSTARAVMEDMGRHLGIGLAGLINIFNPEMIVIGGGVMAAWPLFIDAAQREVMWRAFEIMAKRTRIAAAELGDDSGIVGAAATALRRIGRDAPDAAA